MFSFEVHAEGPRDAARAEALRSNNDAGRAEVAQAVRQALVDTAGDGSTARTHLAGWLSAFEKDNVERYNAQL